MPNLPLTQYIVDNLLPDTSTILPRIGSAAVAAGTGAALYQTTENLRSRWHTGSDWPFNSRSAAFLAAAPTIAKWGSQLKKTWYNARSAFGHSTYASRRPFVSARRSVPPGMTHWANAQWVRRSANTRRSPRTYRRRRAAYTRRRFY